VKRTVKLRTVERTPFFHVDGEPFVDLAYYYGEPLTIDVGELARFLGSAGPGEVVIGRRMDARERRVLADFRRDGDAEVHARVVRRDEDRWRTRGSKKAR
jgi:hypothetical protein